MTNLVLELDCGRIEIETFPDKAPNHVAQIVALCEKGFYDGLVFHRVIEGFMAQGGRSTEPCDNINAEFNDIPHHRGICSMARTPDPNSASSQFFICLGDSHFLDNQYTVWGRVTSGMDVVDAITKGDRQSGAISPVSNSTKIVTFRKA